MREISFRGKDIKTGNWIYGLPYFSAGQGSWFISHTNGWMPSYNNPDEGESTELTEIKAKTLSQFTGLTDKNGVKIFEGDVLLVDGKSKQYVIGGTRGYCYDCNFMDGRTNTTLYHIATDHQCEIIGNLHDGEVQQ